MIALHDGLMLIYVKSLKELYIANNKITNAGVVHLKHLTSLRRLNIDGTAITNKGKGELVKVIPNCYMGCYG